MRYDDEDQPRPKRRPDPADDRTTRTPKRKVRTVRPRTWKDETDVDLEREAPRVEPDGDPACE